MDEFVQDAVSLRITPFMLDSYAHEYEEIIRRRDAHTLEVEALRTSNRNLIAQVSVHQSVPRLSKTLTSHIRAVKL